MTVHSPFRLHRHDPVPAPSSPGDDAVRDRADETPDDRASAPAAGPPEGVVRVGAVGLRSAAAYLLAWMLVLLAVEVLVFWGGYTLLSALGVLTSVSAALATVLGDPVPESGLLPALELPALLPWAVLGGAALAVLWMLMSLALVLVHNCICRITGGPRLRVH
jgi:hypothetical protein